MSADELRSPWSELPELPPARRRAPLPSREPRAAAHEQPAAVTSLDVPELTEDEYRVVAELRDRVSTRLTAEDKNYAAGPRRELTKKLIRDEYDQWLLHEANHGRAAPAVATEERIFAAVLAELDGLGRLAPLLARDDVEDIHFEGCDPTMLRTVDGELVAGPSIASSDEELEQLLRSIGSRSEGGQTSREFSSASPVLNVRLKGVTELGARLQAAMDVLPRPAGVIRVHRFGDPSLGDLYWMHMVDSPVRAFLRAAIEAGVSPLVTGAPGVGKTTLLRALGNTIPWNNVVVTVEDERELGLHLPRWDPDRQQLVKRHAVCRPFESRLPNAEGRGGFDMGDALHLALRASPTWVLVGEVRGAYVTSLLEAATSGIASVMCTIHSPSAGGVFDKVLINALKAHPTPSPELVMRSLAALGLVVHVHRDRSYSRFVSGIYELGPIGDSGRPDLKPIFAPRAADGRAQATGPGMLSDTLAERLNEVGFDLGWLHPDASDWPTGLRPQERAS
jgi:pilus assembly protein CpaF